MGALQFLPPEQRRRHFAGYQRRTRSGGLNAHLVFVEKPFIKAAPDWQKNEYFYTSGDLAAYYHDWEIIRCEERIVDCNSSGIPHRHAGELYNRQKNWLRRNSPPPPSSPSSPPRISKNATVYWNSLRGR